MSRDGAYDDHGPHGRGRSSRSRTSDALAHAEPGPPAWCTTIWLPQEFQRRVLACRRGITFAVGGIGSGKSEVAALLLLIWALLFPRRKDGTPTRWYVVGPEFSLIRHEQFAKILNHCRRLKELGYGSVVRRVIEGQDPRIVLCNGQILVGRSGDQYQRMEGQEVDGGWMDEAQRQPFKAYATFASRQRSASDIRSIISASPEDSPGWVWRAISGEGDPKRGFNRARTRLIARGSGFRVFRWASYANSANDEGNLDVISAILEEGSPALAAQKTRGVFPGTAEAPSTNLLGFVRAFVGPLTLRGDEALPFVMGVDIGETHDFTWLTVVSIRGILLYQERWNAGSPGVPRADFYPYAQDRIEAIARAWHVSKVVFDTAKAGKPILQALERKRVEGVRFEGVSTEGTGRRSALIEALGVALSCGDIRIPSSWTIGDKPTQIVDEVHQLRKEFEEIAVKEGDNRRSFVTPDGGHDDGILSLSLAWSGLAGAASRATTLGTWKQPGAVAIGETPPAPPARPPGSSGLGAWKQPRRSSG